MENHVDAGLVPESFAGYLPQEVVHLLRTRVASEFATISAAGFPIDTPTFYFPDNALTSLDIGTGLAYPAKAERARRNPRVGMLVEGGIDDPVVSIAGIAAVRDANIQANLERYLAETIFSPNVDPAVVPWEKTRQRLYYLARIIVVVFPVHVRWWPARRDMEGPPSEWRARPGTQFASSDAPPGGERPIMPPWRQAPWSDMARQAIAGGLPAHLTLLDTDGFPIPIRALRVELDHEGFVLDVPASAPWSSGPASLSFVGKEMFVGSATRCGNVVAFSVERSLPVLPMMDDRTRMTKHALHQLDSRLHLELERRGQPMPVVPELPPPPTPGALFRADVARNIDVRGIGAGIRQ